MSPTLPGGSVRDRLLGKEAKDYDIATERAAPSEVQKTLPARDGSDRENRSVSCACWSGTVPTKWRRFARMAPIRMDVTPSRSRFVTAEEDAQRRDFTINGLFYDPVADRLIDYVGGEADLHAKILRAIGNPAARFARTTCGCCAPSALPRALASRLSRRRGPRSWRRAPRSASVSAERIRDELNLIFTTAQAGGGAGPARPQRVARRRCCPTSPPCTASSSRRNSIPRATFTSTCG